MTKRFCIKYKRFSKIVKEKYSELVFQFFNFSAEKYDGVTNIGRSFMLGWDLFGKCSSLKLNNDIIDKDIFWDTQEFSGQLVVLLLVAEYEYEYE